MQISKKVLKIISGSLLLLVFLIKLTSPVTRLLQIQKTITTLINNSEENQEDSEKKDDSKTSLKFNEEFDNPPSISPAGFAYLVINNPDPNYFPNLIANHYPTVPTPPPNC